MERNIKAINDFLEIYRARAQKFYKNMLDEFFKEVPEQTKYRLFIRNKGWAVKQEDYDRAIKAINEFNAKLNKERRVDGSCHTGYSEPYWVIGKWNPIQRYALLAYDSKTCTWDRAKMEAEIAIELEDDIQAKYDRIVARASKVVGDITNASGLSVADTGELNGLVEGTLGSCTIKTISAGGYNIQCFHFRVLVRKVA